MVAEEKRSGKWRYDPCAGRNKHRGREEQATLVWVGDVLVGKCPRAFPPELAEQLLNEGIVEIDPRGAGKGPRHIYNVHDGVPYYARCTRRGISYHGCPMSPKEFGKLDDEIKAKLFERARAAGKEEELKRWLTREW
jgi:hypothetical protein